MSRKYFYISNTKIQGTKMYIYKLDPLFFLGGPHCVRVIGSVRYEENL